MAHANARLTPAGRLTLVQRIAAQPRRPIAHIAHEMGISRTTAYRWWSRYQQLGQVGLVDRPSIPTTAPGGPPPASSSASSSCAGASGSARIAARLHLPAPTVHRVLVRHGCNRLAWLDRPTGRPIAATNTHDPVTWSIWMSSSSAASPPGAATGSTAGLPGRSTAAPTDQAAATTTCTPRSMTTPVWLMSRSWATSGPRPAPAFGAAPTTGSLCVYPLPLAPILRSSVDTAFYASDQGFCQSEEVRTFGRYGSG
jgi:transposase-like protein